MPFRKYDCLPQWEKIYVIWILSWNEAWSLSKRDFAEWSKDVLIKDINCCYFPIIFSPLWTDLIYNCRLLKNKREATISATYIAIWHTEDNDRLQKTLVWVSVRLLFRNFLRLEKTTFEIPDSLLNEWNAILYISSILSDGYFYLKLYQDIL